MIVINEKISIPLEELDFQYVRSSGPGGQNVNKVATKAVLRWDVSTTTHLPDSVRERFIEQYRNRINSEGELVLSSDRSRSQSTNADDCLDRLREMILSVADEPVERKKTRPSVSSKRRRVEEKRRQSQKKQLRKPPTQDD